MATPWTAGPDDVLANTFLSGDEPATGHSVPSPPGIAGLTHVGNADKDGTTNSDLAFWGTLAYAGNYSGFRVLDVSADQPRVIADVACNGPQNDVSVYELGGRRFLFQSIDTAQTAENCTSRNAPFVKQGRVGYEGIRVFDVTNPRKPAFVDMVQTACGSHTHTLVPDGDRAFIYVSSYPLGSGVTGTNVVGPGDFRPCASPHRKISIIEVSAPRGAFSFRLKEQALSQDTKPYQDGRVFSNSGLNRRGASANRGLDVYRPAASLGLGGARTWAYSNPQTQEAWQAP